MIPGAHSRTADRRVALFVLGMGRSGTSALTRVLSLCGGTLPPGMLGADSNNPRGNWEPREATILNDVILNRHGSAYYDPTLRPWEKGALVVEDKAACIAGIQKYLSTLPAAPLVVIKDPRITLLSGMWFEAARLAGFDSAAVIAVRDPQETIASFARLIQASPELSSTLWLKYTLLAERDTRGLPRVFVDYANLLDNWRREIKRISAVLPIDLNAQDEAAIEEFLTPDLRRQRHRGEATEPFGTDWNSAVYKALSAAARDEPLDESELDRVFEAYRSNEHVFRTASEDYRRIHNRVMFRLFRKSFILRPTLAIKAMVHRRDGTWA